MAQGKVIIGSIWRHLCYARVALPHWLRTEDLAVELTFDSVNLPLIVLNQSRIPFSVDWAFVPLLILPLIALHRLPLPGVLGLRLILLLDSLPSVYSLFCHGIYMKIWRYPYLGFLFCLSSFSPKGLSQEDRIIIIIFYLVKSLLVDISRCSFSSFDLISGLVSGRDLDSYLILWSSAQPERLALYLVHFGLWVFCFTFIWPRFSSPSSQAKKNVFYEPDARSRRPAIIFPWIKWRSCYQRCYEA